MLAQKIITKDEMIYELMSFPPLFHACLIPVVTFTENNDLSTIIYHPYLSLSLSSSPSLYSFIFPFIPSTSPFYLELPPLISFFRLQDHNQGYTQDEDWWSFYECFKRIREWKKEYLSFSLLSLVFHLGIDGIFGSLSHFPYEREVYLSSLEKI